ncbi:UNVERIFIED_ORG: hypothetical protein M2382_004025 [Enterobacter sp. BIGb0239]
MFSRWEKQNGNPKITVFRSFTLSLFRRGLA